MNKEIPWIEKYRPKTINELIVDEGTYSKVKKIIQEKNMPNIIITGIPGTGKTSTILCIARSLLGRYIRQGVLELNASDDRGIKASDTIINFCKKKFQINKEERTYADHKIVMLDEADNMTNKAQQMINNLMEKYNSTTRFAFTCNNSTKIIEAIQSRCIIFRYKRLSISQVKNRVVDICKIENVHYDSSGIDALVTTADGDMRQALNNLQLTYSGFGKINVDNVYKICEKPHPLIIKKIFISCDTKNLKEALQNLFLLSQKGYSCSDISMGMLNVLKNSKFDEIDLETRIKFYEETGKTAFRISKGLNSMIQLTGFLASLCK
jgi:replication factor C subunit 2/4